jgi:hypothetical protein
MLKLYNKMQTERCREMESDWSGAFPTMEILEKKKGKSDGIMQSEQLPFVKGARHTWPLGMEFCP